MTEVVLCKSFYYFFASGDLRGVNGMFSLGVKSVVIEGLKNEFRLRSRLDSHHK